ncbi:MAG: methyltransferase [Chloroflexi bacterium]|nr:methyltransferase [Chloroflexota bacterium]MBK7176809.1 methyltransferase [Chloroflexota bacterium]MBK7918182.1 methyltransferase [Chloroflexota bacterium]
MTTSPTDHSVLTATMTGGLADLRLAHPPGTFALTPASRIALTAVGQQRHLLSGLGLDWGSGVGGLAILAARITAVTQVVGLEISAANVAIAQQNARENGAAHKVRFLLSDGYTPVESDDGRFLDTFSGQTSFILANPPASDGDDGFTFRRIVLAGGRPFLRPGGVVFLNISSQYGRERIEGLLTDAPGYAYGGVLASSGWVPFDLQRPDLRQNLRDYVNEESAGGLRYEFGRPSGAETSCDAQTAQTWFEQTGESPLSRWEVHMFRRTADK